MYYGFQQNDPLHHPTVKLVVSPPWVSTESLQRAFLEPIMCHQTAKDNQIIWGDPLIWNIKSKTKWYKCPQRGKRYYTNKKNKS